MSGIFRQFRSLANKDKLRFGAVMLLVPCLKVCLRLIGFNKTVALLKLFPGKPETIGKHSIARYRALLKLCYEFFPVDGLCLPISLTFWWMLRRRGVETKLYFGANKTGGKLTAHAWIEYEGRPITVDRNIGNRYKSLEIPIA